MTKKKSNRLAGQTPQERLAALSQEISERSVKCWNPDIEKRAQYLPFRDARQGNITAALMRIDPSLSQFDSLSPRFREMLFSQLKELNWNDRDRDLARDRLVGLGMTLLHEDFRDAREAFVGLVKKGDYTASFALGRFGEALALDAFKEVREVLIQQVREGNSSALHVLVELGSKVLALDAFKEAREVILERVNKDDTIVCYVLYELIDLIDSDKFRTEWEIIRKKATEQTHGRLQRAKQGYYDSEHSLQIMYMELATDACRERREALVEQVIHGDESVLIELSHVDRALRLDAFKGVREALVDQARKGNEFALSALGNLCEALATDNFNDERNVLVEQAKKGEKNALYALGWLGAALSTSAFMYEREILVQKVKEGIHMTGKHGVMSAEHIANGDSIQYAVRALGNLGEVLASDTLQDARNALVQLSNKGSKCSLEALTNLGAVLSTDAFKDERETIIQQAKKRNYSALHALNKLGGILFIFQDAREVLLEQAKLGDRLALSALNEVLSLKWRFLGGCSVRIVRVWDLACGKHPCEERTFSIWNWKFAARLRLYFQRGGDTR